jgi:hypothetical protein
MLQAQVFKKLCSIKETIKYGVCAKLWFWKFWSLLLFPALFLFNIVCRRNVNDFVMSQVRMMSAWVKNLCLIHLFQRG